MYTDNMIYVLVKEKSKGILKFPRCNIETSAYLGKNGVTSKKKEGDGKTPLGEFELGLLLGKEFIKNKNNLQYIQITQKLYWVDDCKSKYYNQLIDISKVQKDWDSAEHLIKYPIQYEYLIEVKANPNNIPGKGSAIFLHCTNNNPTEGCIAINRMAMKRIMENINNYTKIKIF